MTSHQKIGRKLELAAVAFATGFTAHAHSSSSLGMLAGTLAVCALVARSTFDKRGSTAARL